MSLLMILIGPSGAGKTTLCHALMGRFPECEFSISVTTRPPRSGEVDGEDYHFVSKARFEEMVDAGEFAEYAVVHGNCYGTTIATIEDAQERGKSVLFDIDVQGAEQLLQAFPGAVSVMILPPSMERLEARLRNRATDGDEVIERRLAKAREEMRTIGRFAYAIVNRDLDAAKEDISAIYRAERLRTARGLPPEARALGIDVATDSPEASRDTGLTR